MINNSIILKAAKRALVCSVVMLLSISVSAQSFRNRHGAFDGGDDYHFGYISGSVGYSMLQTSLPGTMPKGNVGGTIGLGYEFRNSGFWANVGAQLTFHRSSLTIDQMTYHIGEPGSGVNAVDTQGKPATFHYRVDQKDEIKWNFVDVPMLVGYYIRGFHVGGGLKISYALSPKTKTTGTYNLSATNHDYNVTFSDMPDRGYTDYNFECLQKNRLNVGVSLIGEIGYDLLSSVPTRSRICHVLKASFYFEYGLNNHLRGTATPQERVVPNPNNLREAQITPYVNTFEKPNHTVPFFTGFKLTYMIGGSRTARVGMHHGCMCYN